MRTLLNKILYIVAIIAVMIVVLKGIIFNTTETDCHIFGIAALFIIMDKLDENINRKED